MNELVGKALEEDEAFYAGIFGEESDSSFLFSLLQSFLFHILLLLLLLHSLFKLHFLLLHLFLRLLVILRL